MRLDYSQEKVHLESQNYKNQEQDKNWKLAVFQGSRLVISCGGPKY